MKYETKKCSCDFSDGQCVWLCHKSLHCHPTVAACLTTNQSIIFIVESQHHQDYYDLDESTCDSSDKRILYVISIKWGEYCCEDIYRNKRKKKMICTLIKTHDDISPSPSTQVTSPWMSCKYVPVMTVFKIKISSKTVLVREPTETQSWIVFFRWLENNINLGLQKHKRLSNTN